jgi:phosphohistidine phosphatase
MERREEVWILRHGEAEPVKRADGERHLTEAGEAAASAVGASLADRGLSAQRVLASPRERARRTAVLAAAAMAGSGTAPVVETDRRLAFGGDARGLVEELRSGGDLPALLVGHNPDLEHLVFLLSGEEVRMGTAALVRIGFEEEGGGRILERP